MEKKKKQVNKMPDWMKKQLELVDKRIQDWSPAKQQWAGVQSDQQCLSEPPIEEK